MLSTLAKYILKMFKRLKEEVIVITHSTYLNRRSILSKKGPTFKTFHLLLENGIKFEKITYKNSKSVVSEGSCKNEFEICICNYKILYIYCRYPSKD